MKTSSFSLRVMRRVSALHSAKLSQTVGKSAFSSLKDFPVSDAVMSFYERSSSKLPTMLSVGKVIPT
ncbi:unnamed protein product [Lasius platythorax]|uniref:Uncharacterized protein n=1 Tax=Lasius platythorax TaxID=488582 RepID=A0AAV2P0L7_9HYME